MKNLIIFIIDFFKCRKTPFKVSNCSQPILICIILISFIPACQPAPAFCDNSKNLIASWYSLESLKKEGTFKRTKGVMADGSLYNEKAFTCATRDFPLHSLVNITNKKNGKSVICEVRDRIAKRFKGKRIDLTPVAFECISELKTGLVAVSVERIN